MIIALLIKIKVIVDLL